MRLNPEARSALDQVPWSSLVPSSPKAQFAFSIDKKESKGALRKVSAPLSRYKTE
jgi:hypothetical protein